MSKTTRVTFALLAAAASAAALERAPLVTYGPTASVSEGDDDFRQVLFVEVPAQAAGPVYLRILDADCGGDLDSAQGAWDTKTRFTLYGGAGAASAAGLKGRTPSADALRAGTVLADRTAGVDAELNGKWTVLAKLDPAQGEQLAGRAVFKLVVEGLSGNDGNVFDVAVSAEESRQAAAEGVRVLSYAPTLRNPGPASVAELRLALPPAGSELAVSSFDLGTAHLSLATALRELPLATSQAEWVDGRVSVPAEAGGALAAVTFEGGTESPNDATLAVSGPEGPLAFALPFLLWRHNQRPVAVGRTSAVSDCLSVAFDGSGSSDADGDALELLWDFGDGQQGTGARLTHAYQKPGTYQATLVASDASGQVGRGAAQRLTVVVNDPPRAVAGPDRVVAPLQEVTLDGSRSADTDGTVARWLWDFGDGARGEGAKPQHAWGAPGRYRVLLRVEDDSKQACNSGEASLTVTVNAPPTAVAGPSRRASVGEALSFDAGRSFDTDGRLAAWQWDFGDGSTATGATASHAYATPGTFTAEVAVKDDADVGNSTARDSLTVTVNAPPVPKPGAARHVAVGEVVPFDASASSDPDGKLVAWEWDFGNGARAEGQKVSYAYPEPKTHTVTLRVKDDSGLPSGVREATTTVVVNGPPQARAGGDRVVTSSEVHFDGSASRDADGQVTRWQWEFGDGATAEGPTPVHVYRRSGRYRVRLTVTDDSGTANASGREEATVVVNQVPIADAGPDRLASPGQELAFSAAESLDPDGEVTSWAWDLGDGTTASTGAVSHRYDAPGLYTVRLTVADDSGHPTGVAHDEAVVRVNAPPVANPGPAVLAAPGQVIELDGSGSSDPDGKVTAWRWTFSDGQEVAGPKAKRKFERPGLYTARLTVSDDSGASNGEASDVVRLRVNAPPRAQAGPDVVACDATVTVDGSRSADPDGDPLGYAWDFGDGTPPQQGARAVHTYVKAGTYPVVLTVDDGTGLGNARNSVTLTAVVNAPPVADAGGGRTACAGKPSIFDASRSRDPEGGPLKYRWEFGDGTSAEGVNPTKTYLKGGVYEATLTVTDDSGLTCNTGADRVAVQVAESPVADAGEDQKVCANSEVRFDGSRSRDFDGLVNSYTWDFGDGGTAGGATPTHTYTRAGVYRAALTITGDQIGECDNTDRKSATITVFAAPVAKFTLPRVAALGQALSFDASASSPEGAKFTSWSWDFGDGEKGEGEKASHAYAKPGRYLAVLTVQTDSGTSCSSTSARNLVTVNAPPVATAEAPKLLGVNQEALFDAFASRDPDGSLVSYRWDFGDGRSASGARVRHQYAKPGRYEAKLEVQDDSGVENGTATARYPVVVNAEPQPAIAIPGQACPGAAIQVSGAGTTDRDGGAAKLTWDLGDGSSAEGAEVTHAYRLPGRYQVSLVADDGTGVSNARSKAAAVLIVNDPPRADPGAPQVVCPGTPAHFDGSRSADRDGKALTYRWDFGDGGEGEGRLATHTYAAPGARTVTLQVSDDSGTPCGTVQATVPVKVDATPVAQAGPDREAWVGGAHDEVAFDATGSSDPDGDRLTYQWDFGDGGTDTGALVSHAYARPGRYLVKLRVKDGTGAACGEAWDEAVVDVRERK